MKDIQNKKFTLTADGRLEVYSYELASILNKYYKVYDKGNYRFKPGEEAIFKVSQHDYNFIVNKYLEKQ